MESELVHDNPWNPASRFGGWEWRKPRHSEHYRTCSFCGSIHPEDLAAETAGTGTCISCGEQGWEAHFRAQSKATNYVGSREPEHEYNSGGWYASWADQKYGWPHKFYVEGMPTRDPNVLSVLSATNNPSKSEQTGWVLTKDLTRAQKKLIKDSGWSGSNYTAYQFWHRPYCYAKFYTEHLRDPNISPEAVATIERVSNVHFEWLEDGRVRWSRP